MCSKKRRQPHDQWNKALERCWYDAWSPRRNIEERKDTSRCQDWTNAPQRRLVSRRIHTGWMRQFANQRRIPFDRALDFANKEKITELLYPLFVHNIGALLYHPTNQARPSIGNAAMAAASRRSDPQQDYMRTPQGTQPPSLHHHHSMNNPVGAHVPQPPHSIAPHPAAGRPGLDRAHTFPTPPTSASSIMGMGNSGSSYEFGAPSSMQPGQPLSIDTGLSNARSVPTTPATTPPGTSSQSMQQYQTSQPYDTSRQMYSAPGGYPQYGSQQGMNRYGQLQPSPHIKNEMAPPARAGAEQHSEDSKAHDGYSGQSREHASGEDAEGEHEGEYTHTSASYGAHRAPYSYNPNATPGSMRDQSHVSPEMTHSPHQNGSGRATPRTANNYNGYSTPQRTQLPSSNLYNVMSDTGAGAQNGTESYSAHSGYSAQQYPSMNGAPPSNKRVREMDDQEDPYGRPNSAGGENGLKRQRTIGEADRPMSQPRSVMAGPGRKR